MKKKPWELPIGKIELNTLRPEPKEALAKEDPTDVILAGMQERGFASLWTAQNNNHKLNVFSDKLKLLFLRHYAVTGRLAYSAALAGVSRYTVNTYKRKDPIFAEALHEAKAYFRDLLSGEMYRRDRKSVV